MKKYVLVLIICGLSTLAKAQLNGDMGLSFAYFDAEPYNQILKKYDDNGSQIGLEDAFGKNRLMTGLQAGISYHWEVVSLEAFYRNQFNNPDAEIIEPVSEDAIQKNVYLSLTSLGTGLTFNYENFSFGGTVETLESKIRIRTNENRTRLTAVKERDWGSRFFVEFPFYKTTSLTLSLRPFYYLPWKSLNLEDFDALLNPDGSADLDNYDADFKNFGIQLIFHNGPRYRN